MKIYTHQHVDLDAVCSVWAAWRYRAGDEDVVVSFVPANWDGKGLTAEDLAVDLPCGIKGKGCAFREVLRRFVEDPAELEALEPLVQHVEFCDQGKIFELPSHLQIGSLSIIPLALLGREWPDEKIIAHFLPILDGIRLWLLQRRAAERKADQCEVVKGARAVVAQVRRRTGECRPVQPRRGFRRVRGRE